MRTIRELLLDDRQPDLQPVSIASGRWAHRRKAGGHIININWMQQCLASIDDTEHAFLN